MSDWFDKIPIFIQLEKNIESGQDYCFKISPFSSSNSLSLWSKNKTHIGDLVNGQVCFTVIPEMIGDELLLASADPIDTSNTLFCLQQGNFRCSPNPTELVHAKSYQLSQPLSLNTDYTLSVEGAQDDWVGVWLGEDYFAGYLKDGQLGIRLQNLLIGEGSKTATTKQFDFFLSDHNIKVGDILRISTRARINNDSRGNKFDIYLKKQPASAISGTLSPVFELSEVWKIYTYSFQITQAMINDCEWLYIRYNTAPGNSSSLDDYIEIGSTVVTIASYPIHPSDFSHIILKSLSPTTCISKAMLARSSVRQDWLMAPEDIYGLTAGSERVVHINYNGLIKSDGQMYGGTTNPSSTTRLNYDGNYVATELTAISRLKLSDNAYWQYNPSTNSVELIFL